MNKKKLSMVIIYICVFVTIYLSNGCTTTYTTKSKTITQNHRVDEKEVIKTTIKKFILGPGDEIKISVYRNSDLEKTIRINSSGEITYPFLGDIQAAGLDVFQLRDKIREGLSRYIINPQVSVDVIAVRSQKIMVLGEVNNPGLFNLETPMNAIEAISRAGGFTLEAKKKSVLLIRGGLEDPQLTKLDIDGFLNRQDMTQNIALQNGDILYIPATFIANVSRFFNHLSNIISPVVQAGFGYWLGQHIEAGPGTGTGVSGLVVSPRQ